MSRFSAGIKGRTIWRCVTHRCFSVTLIASRRPPAARDCPRRVAITAPVRRHPSRQHRRSPEKEQPGLLTPKPPPNPNARPLPSPSGRRWTIVGSLRSKVGKRSFFVSAASFSGPAFSAPRFSPSPSLPRRKTSPPTRGDLLKSTSTGEGWRLGFSVKGDGQKTHSRAEKKRP